jgi:hypothetical protein
MIGTNNQKENRMAKKVTVEGEVVTKDGKGHAIEFYEETFILDDSIPTADHARCIIQSAFITEALRKKVENFKRVRTCKVIGFEDSNETAETSDVDKLLLEATTLGCVPENIDNYRRPDFKVKALQKAIDAHKKNAEKFKPELQDVD